jgi:hypothetical protein
VRLNCDLSPPHWKRELDGGMSCLLSFSLYVCLLSCFLYVCLFSPFSLSQNSDSTNSRPLPAAMMTQTGTKATSTPRTFWNISSSASARGRSGGSTRSSGGASTRARRSGRSSWGSPLRRCIASTSRRRRRIGRRRRSDIFWSSHTIYMRKRYVCMRVWHARAVRISYRERVARYYLTAR